MLFINENRLNLFSFSSNNFAVLMDFDKTMTTMDSDDSWTVIQNPTIVNPKLSVQSNQLFDKYGPIEMDYNLPFDVKSTHMYNWYFHVLNLYYEYGLTYQNLVSCVNCSNITLRAGLKELLLSFYQNHIPVIILSAGIGNVIELVLKSHKCFYNNISIISNFFTFEDDILLPFSNPIIHTCNKTIDLLPNSLKQQLFKKDYFLLFGDFIEDIHMVSKKALNKTLCFGFLEKNVEANFNFYQNSFDIVLTENSSFYDVKNILNRRMKKSN
ncbi:MAG: hypothetical protein HFJ27_06280 [Clostridia bacterium]|nr:hypothetical protein [Clostridia bacterium]